MKGGTGTSPQTRGWSAVRETKKSYQGAVSPLFQERRMKQHSERQASGEVASQPKLADNRMSDSAEPSTSGEKN